MVPVQFLWLSLYVHPSFSIILEACATSLQVRVLCFFLARVPAASASFVSELYLFLL